MTATDHLYFQTSVLRLHERTVIFSRIGEFRHVARPLTIVRPRIPTARVNLRTGYLPVVIPCLCLNSIMVQFGAEKFAS